jgi:peptide/nickel transport system substrate-binding protein
MKKLCYLFALTLFLFGCNGKDKNEQTISDENLKPRTGGNITIALLNDLDFLNPVISTDVPSEWVSDLIFPSFTDVVWNDSSAAIEFKPFYAKSWEYSNDGKDLTYFLKYNAYWEDGTRISPKDITFSYKLYSNPLIPSTKRYNLIYFYKNKRNEPDIDKSLEVKNDSIIIFHFTRSYPLQLYHTNLKFIPEHHFKDVNPKDLRNHPNNFKPIGAGPYKLDKWEENQFINLSRNENYTISGKPYIDKIIFKVIPEYTTRLTALKSNEIDFMDAVQPQDVGDIKKNYPKLNLVALTDRYYDYVSWSNIDNEYYRKYKKIRPHHLFGSKNIRKALTMAINREEIINGFLGEYGMICNGPVSPVFKWAYNNDIKPYPYNPNESQKLLKDEGWTDEDGDGILEKNGRKFEFTLYLSGNPRREYAANIIQSNLKKIGIDINIEKLEWNVFLEKIDKRKIDVFINGMGITPQIDLSDYWISDLEKTQSNVSGFQNKRVDELIHLADNVKNIKDAAPYWKEFQAIIHEEQPVTFLYWFANIIGVNKRIRNCKSNIWDSYNHIWEWWVE